jgi:hypothetical protein
LRVWICRGLCGDGRLEVFMGSVPTYVGGFHVGFIASSPVIVADVRRKIELPCAT